MKLKKTIPMIALVAIMLVAFALPAAAQDDGVTYPLNTITVTGSGSAAGAPDIANLEIGVETSDPDIAIAFNNNSETMQAVIDAIVAAGVAAEDVRTSGLNIYYRDARNYDMMSAEMNGDGDQREYVVNNQVRITVRDTSLIADILNAAVSAGANNIYGLNFGIDERDALESAARADAMEDARARATELASLAGAELGDVVVINETYGGGSTAFDVANMSVGMGGGAPIEPGQLSVTVQLQVTFTLAR